MSQAAKVRAILQGTLTAEYIATQAARRAARLSGLIKARKAGLIGH